MRGDSLERIMAGQIDWHRHLDWQKISGTLDQKTGKITYGRENLGLVWKKTQKNIIIRKKRGPIFVWLGVTINRNDIFVAARKKGKNIRILTDTCSLDW